eukprot:scaffold80857_cov36-Phaeocystis_antarctica.AAC.1
MRDVACDTIPLYLVLYLTRTARRQHKEVQRGAEPYLWDTFQARPSPSPRASSNLTLTLTLTRNLALPLGHFPGPLTMEEGPTRHATRCDQPSRSNPNPNPNPAPNQP